MLPSHEVSSPDSALAAPAPAGQGSRASGRARPAAAGRRGVPLVFLVALLAFLLASFPARNSDLWSHLAAGKGLAHGAFALGPTWLFDLACYGLYAGLGGAALVLAKALLVAGLALVLLRLARPGPGWWLPAACTALALLAMSTRLLPDPATVSCLFLALALWFVRKEEPEGPSASPAAFPLLPPWPLLVLFLVWAAVDSRCVVGLAVVALLWLGDALDAARSAHPPGLRAARPLVALAVLAAVCLLNPALSGLFLPSRDPSWLGAVLGGGAGDGAFGKAYLARLGHSPAGMAYFPLLGLGLLSFGLNLSRWSWRRFLPWLTLALWSVAEARAIPFFAVVAGPALAWNLHDVLAPRLAGGRRPGWTELVTAGRVLTALLALALLVCAWPGWLQGPPFEPRRWAVEVSPALEKGAADLGRWHREGKLGPDAQGVYLSPEAADAFAWFCPEEKGRWDKGLAEALGGDAAAAPDWRARLRADGVNHLILYSPDHGRLFAALGPLLAAPQEWPLLYLEGDLAVFGWRDPAAPGAADRFRGLELDLNRLAFHPPRNQRAPEKPPAAAAEARPWWEAFWKPAPPRPLDQEEATLHLFHAESLRRSAKFRHLAAWQGGELAGLVAAAAGWAGPAALLDAQARLTLFQPDLPEPGAAPAGTPALDRLVLRLQQGYTLQHDDAPPALLYLAIRAARRAVAANPDEAQAYLVLGESYLRLLHSTRERSWAMRLPELAALRRAQASAALNRAVTLKPGFAQAHLSLGGLYDELGYLDLALDQLRTYQKLAHEAGPPPGVDPGAFREAEARFQERLDALAADVAKRASAFEVESAKARVLDRALLASQKGLGGKARDLLRESDISNFGTQGMALELELLLKTGEPEKVRDWLTPDHEAALGTTSYHWLRAQAQAACGDYGQAEEECDRLGRPPAPPGGKASSLPRRIMMALVVAQTVLDEHIDQETAPSLLRRGLRRSDTHVRIATLSRGMRQEADANVLLGLLALEEGRADRAEGAFRVALATWGDEATAATGGGLDFSGRPIAQACLAWLE